MACLGANAQDLIVHGTVISASDKEPLIGATVKEKGINNATVTDLSGNFSLKVKNAATLIFSYVGFQMKEVKASANMNVLNSSG